MNFRFIFFLLFTCSVLFTTPLFVFAQETIVRSISFPVNGEYALTDNFGAPRSGGRTHEGTDIMAEKMTPLVSAVSGRVTYVTEVEQSWGYAVYIEDSEGYSYRYLHLNNDTPGTDDGSGGFSNAIAPGIMQGVNVTSGQLLGWVGDSGNAEETGSHLHFEIITPDGTPINAYPSLVAAIAATVPRSSYMFTRDLDVGDTGLDVQQLQKYLNAAGFTVAETGPGSMGNETQYFGFATQAALISFQKKYNISPAVGYFGPLTRSIINGISTTSQVPSFGLKVGDLVKNEKFAEVFYVSESLQLRWIVNEVAAEKHFGPTWNQNIILFEDLSLTGLKFGENLE